MKKITGIIILLLISISVFPQVKTGEGKTVKTMTVYEQKPGKGKEAAIIDEEVSYDSKGRTIAEKEYKNGVLDKVVRYEYDQNGHKTKETELDGEGNKVKVTEYSYNVDLRIEKSVYDGNGKLISRKTYKYETY